MNIPTVLNRPPAPAELQDLNVLADGSVVLNRDHTNVEFSFNACGLSFSAATRLTDSGPMLQIAADVSSDPYSAEGVPMREAAHALIRASQAAPHCRLMVSKHKRIYCVGRTRIEDNWTPTALLTAAVELILEARPYLLVLRDIVPNWSKPAT